VSIFGYSDRLTHALAFAAKHHDGEARKGTRAPYFIQPASVALILTRYGCRDEVVVAAILARVVEDWVLAGYTRALLEERIGSKFGAEMLGLLLTVTRRRHDDVGGTLTSEEQQRDLLVRLATAPTEAHWILAADRLHEASTVLADLRRTQFPEGVWSRVPGRKVALLARHERTVAALAAAGFAAPILTEWRDALAALRDYTDAD
jgi:(p)ppGpp synthase/HD superfamily hydrolase